ncbi:hypothetical protein BGZ63DRAFT_365006 [Mariannaea sp. PMI_226]|nr:hypothetical protein BGZ63DRAFT_365006 [Mariannaea sp. PMI_226]
MIDATTQSQGPLEGYLVNDGVLAKDEIGWLKKSSPSEPIETLRQRYEQDGYVFLKGLLPRETVLECRKAYFDFLKPTGVLKPGTDSVDGVFNTKNDGADFPSIGAGPDLDNRTGPGSFAGLVEQAHTEDFYLNFARHPALKEFITKLKQWTDDETLLLPRSLLRNNTPQNKAIGVHYDQSFLRHGEATSVTAWIPIGDISLQGGGLIYLEGSDALGQRIEEDFDKQARERGMTDEQRLDAFNANMMTTGWLGNGPIQFSKEHGGGRWLLTEFEAGDVVLHKPHMIHASTINRDPENRIRLGTDLRFVDTSKPYDKRWLHPYRFDDNL